MEKTFFTSYLHKIICGFKNILKLINSNEELKRTFLNRDTSEI